MNKKEIEKIDKMIDELDTAVGMLLIVAMCDKTVKEAMEKVRDVSFDLGMML